MGAFVSMAPGAPAIAAACLGSNTILSFLKGYTTTAAIGGADMRTSPGSYHLWILILGLFIQRL
jgi:hypothetical protein